MGKRGFCHTTFFLVLGRSLGIAEILGVSWDGLGGSWIVLGDPCGSGAQYIGTTVFQTLRFFGLGGGRLGRGSWIIVKLRGIV